MSRAILFWVLMLLWLFFGIAGHWPLYVAGNYFLVGDDILRFVLFALLGWKVYGPALHD